MADEVTNIYSLSRPTAIGQRRKANDAAALFDYLFPEFQTGAHILEIGPGYGYFARECLRRGLRYTGVEPSAELCAVLRREGITVLDKPVPPIEAEDESLDLVHSNDFVEHLPTYPDVERFFRESFRVLRPGGHISIITPNYRTLKDLFFRYEYQHSFVTTRERLNKFLKDCGFQIVTSRDFLFWLSPRINILDRLVAHTLIPLARNPLLEFVITRMTSEDFLFRIHKNVYDHVAILAQKPDVVHGDDMRGRTS
jgi:SAM-dependent methyltransferase